MRFAVEEFLSYEPLKARKKKNLVQMSYLQRRVTRFAVELFFLRFAQLKKAKDFLRQATYEDNVPCVLNQEFLFLVHEYWSSEATRLG